MPSKGRGPSQRGTFRSPTYPSTLSGAVRDEARDLNGSRQCLRSHQQLRAGQARRAAEGQGAGPTRRISSPAVWHAGCGQPLAPELAAEGVGYVIGEQTAFWHDGEQRFAWLHRGLGVLIGHGCPWSSPCQERGDGWARETPSDDDDESDKSKCPWTRVDCAWHIGFRVRVKSSNETLSPEGPATHHATANSTTHFSAGRRH